MTGATAVACRPRDPGPAAPPAVDVRGVDPAVAAAIESASAAVRSTPMEPAAWGRLGMVLYTHEFMAGAREAFARAERLDDTDARWPYFLGLIARVEQPDEAIPALERSVALAARGLDAPRVQLADLLQ